MIKYYYKNIDSSTQRNMNKTTEVYIFKNDAFHLIGEQHDNSASWAGHVCAMCNVITSYKAHKVNNPNVAPHNKGMFVRDDIKLIQLP